MARASVWGLGTALAYRSLDPDAQAELLCLYHAARHQEGEEAKVVLASTAAELIHAYWNRENSRQPQVGGSQATPDQVKGRRKTAAEPRELGGDGEITESMFRS